MIHIQTIFVGQPQTHRDSRGEWRSSIFRAPVNGPIFLGERGLTGDQVTDSKHHGSIDQAVCCHDQSHYDYWNQAYGLQGEACLGPGSVGENWTLVNAPEAAVCVGDVYDVGEATIQITAPRFPCSTQERKLRLPHFTQRSQETMRTGFYLRVLRSGWVVAGDTWTLKDRPQPDFSLDLINQGMLSDCEPEIVQRMLTLPELAEGWKQMLVKRYPALVGNVK